MKKDGFLAEALCAVVEHHKKKARKGNPNYFLDQKKQLWYAMMYAVHKEEDEQRVREAKDGSTGK